MGPVMKRFIRWFQHLFFGHGLWIPIETADAISRGEVFGYRIKLKDGRRFILLAEENFLKLCDRHGVVPDYLTPSSDAKEVLH